MPDKVEGLWKPLERHLAAEGVELDDLELTGGGAVLRVTVDAPDGVDIDRIAALARSMSRLLDDQDPLAGPYSLEVSSPGLERPLRRPAHWLKSVGRQVKVKTSTPGADSHVLKGTIAAADEDGFELDSAGTAVRISYDEVASARTVFNWERAPKPGGRRR